MADETGSVSGLSSGVASSASSGRGRTFEKCPHFGVICHHLEDVKSNGLPTPEYNSFLAEFDHTVHESLEREGRGRVMLVKTFGGKRSYYACLGFEDCGKQWSEELRGEYPDLKMEWSFKTGHARKFYSAYRNDFPW